MLGIHVERLIRWVILVFFVALPLVANDVDLFHGDVIAVGAPAYAFEGGVGFGQVYSPSGQYKGNLYQNAGSLAEEVLVGFDGIVYVADQEVVRRFTLQGHELPPFGFFEGYVSGLAMDARGNLYVATFGRYDVCTSTPLQDVANFPDEILADVRVRTNGEILVYRSGSLIRLDPVGKELYNYGGMVRVALDPDGRSFWTTSAGRLFRVDIDTGILLAGPIPLIVFPTSPDFLLVARGLAVVGDPRAAFAGSPRFSPRRRAARR